MHRGSRELPGHERPKVPSSTRSSRIVGAARAGVGLRELSQFRNFAGRNGTDFINLSFHQPQLVTRTISREAALSFSTG